MESLSNIIGTANTATGKAAPYSESNNAANGSDALFSNINGNFNTANGRLSLWQNPDGSDIYCKLSVLPAAG